MTAPVPCPACDRYRLVLRDIERFAVTSHTKTFAQERITALARAALADPDAPPAPQEEVTWYPP